MTTKAKILDVALTLFSVEGYDAVSIRDIGKQVGIKESSIYNHFENKQAIFEGILSFCQDHMMKHYQAMNLDQTLRGDYAIYDQIPLETLTAIAREHFAFYVSDSVMLRYRRLLTIEQFRNPAMSVRFRDLFIDQPLQFQSRLFPYLVDHNALANDDPLQMAYEFYAPLFLLMCRYDSLSDEADQALTHHIAHFVHKNAPKDRD